MPAQPIREKPAQQRTDHAAEAEYGAEHPLVPRPLGWRIQVGNDREGARVKRGRTQPLHRAERDERPGRPGEPAQHRAGEEQDDSHEQHELAPDLVAQLAIHRHHDRRGHEVGRREPGVERGNDVQIALDRGTRRAHHRLVERRKEEPDQGAGQRDHLVAMGQVVARVVPRPASAWTSARARRGGWGRRHGGVEDSTPRRAAVCSRRIPEPRGRLWPNPSRPPSNTPMAGPVAEISMCSA